VTDEGRQELEKKWRRRWDVMLMFFPAQALDVKVVMPITDAYQVRISIDAKKFEGRGGKPQG
jgi:hypothetical protein